MPPKIATAAHFLLHHKSPHLLKYLPAANPQQKQMKEMQRSNIA
jgi:hypothetical protein